MIESISINNFQSHKATRLKLAPTVNTLQGNSDCGKSAVMRAINWLLFNPAGDYFVSDWAKKGKTIAMAVAILLYFHICPMRNVRGGEEGLDRGRIEVI